MQDAWTKYLNQIVNQTPDAQASRVNKQSFEPSGERRVLTLLTWRGALTVSADRQLDNESRFFIMDRLVQTISEVIYHYEGLIDHFTGTRLTAVFGLPIIHENDAGRALRAALDIAAALRLLNEELSGLYGVTVQSQTGIHAGPVIVSRNAGKDNWQLIGRATQRVAGLRDQAPADSILVSAEIYQQTQMMFNYADSPVSQPVGTASSYLLKGALQNPGAYRGTISALVPMVGRQHALQLLCNAWDEVLAGHNGRYAFVTGDAGVGKTRLISEFISRVHESKAHVYQSSCETYARRKPLYLISDLLTQVLSVPDTDAVDDRYAALVEGLDKLEIPKTQYLPFLASVLDLSLSSTQHAISIDRLDDTILQKMTHAALQKLVLAVAAQQPAVFIFEDLHWGDPASLRAVAHLIQTTEDAAVMFILVSRDSENQEVIQPLLDASINHVNTPVDIHLLPFQKSDCVAFVDLLIPQGAGAGESLRELVVERSEGNPFYAEEIVRMLAERGALQKRNGIYKVMPEALSMIGQIPTSLMGLLLARMDHLQDHQRRLLQVASVLGSQITPALLCNLLDIDLAAVEITLRYLVDYGYLMPRADNAYSLHNQYTFQHALVQEVVYGTLLSRDQKLLHGKLAQCIEQDQDTTSPGVIETLAFHYYHSAEPAKAASYLVDAASLASRRSDYAGARDYYQNALEPRVAAALSTQQVSQAKIGLGRVLKHTGQYSEAKEILESALKEALFGSLRADMLSTLVSGIRELADLRHMEGDSEEAYAFLLSGQLAIEEQGRDKHFELWRSVLERMAWIRFREGRLDEAFTLGSSATLDAELENDPDPITLASLYNTMAGISWQKGDPKQATDYLALSLKLYQRVQYPFGMANTYINLGVLHYSLGDWQAAEQELTRASALWRQIGDYNQRSITLNNLGHLYLSMGRLEDAESYLGESMQIFNTLGDTWGQGRTYISLTRLALAQNDLDTASRNVAEAEVRFKELDRIETELEYVKARIMHRAGQTDAQQAVEQTLELARNRQQIEEQIECLRLLGEIKGQAGYYEDAEKLTRESVNLSLQADAPYWVGLSLSALGDLYALVYTSRGANYQHYLNRARTTYRRAVEYLMDLGAMRDLASVNAKLKQLNEAARTVKDKNKQLSAGQDTTMNEKKNSGNYPLPKGENRTVTVVWISTVPMETATEDDIFEALGPVTSLLSRTAEHYHARFDQHGHGMMLVFGADQTLEDDVENAILAAFSISLQLVAPELSDSLHLGIGVDTGKVITGQIGSQYHTEFVIHGGLIERVQLLANGAPAGMILATQAVQQATARIAEYSLHEDLPDTYKLEALIDKPAAPRGIEGLHARMVGRESKLENMLSKSDQLNKGVGALIWIEGEPGIGKSRLMNEYAAAMQAKNVRVYRAKCTAHSSTRPFSLFADLVTQIFGIIPADDQAAITAKIAAAFTSYPGSIQSTRPYLEVILGIWPTGTAGERLSRLEPEQLRQQIFVSTRRFVKQLARQHPMVILLDDIHWIDPISAELLSFLLTIVAVEPIVLVCAQRRQGSDAPNDRLVRVQSLLPNLTLRLSLERLSELDRLQLLSELIPDTEIPEVIKQVILMQSDGNPYFVEEYLKTMLDQGVIIRRDDTWLVRGDLNSVEIEVPNTLEALLRSRVDSLPDDLREVMQTAAVIGSPFDSALLDKVLDKPAGEMLLNRLASRMLIRRVPGFDHWEFHHPMFADVIYSSMLQARRSQLHEAVAQILLNEQSADDEDNVELLAYHLMRAGKENTALVYLVTAGEKAAARYANEVAIEYLETAGNALNTATDTPDDVRWRLAAALGDVYRALGRHEDSIAALRTGLALTQTGKLNSTKRAGLYRRLGETSRRQGDHAEALKFYNVATASIKAQDSDEAYAEMARTYLGVAWVYFRQGEMPRALHAVKQCQDAAEKVDALAELSSVENMLGGIYARRSEWEQAQQHTRKAMVLREQMGYTWGVAGTLSNLGILDILNGSWQRARSCFERSIALREDMDDADGMALVLNNLANLNRDQGKLTEAETLFRRSLSTLELFDHSYHYANAMQGLGSVLLLQGQGDMAWTVLDSAVALAGELEASDLLLDGYCWQVEVLRGASEFAQAQSIITKALALANEMHHQSSIATLWRISSDIALGMGDMEQAQLCLGHSQELLEVVTSILERGRIRMQAAKVALILGNHTLAKSEAQAARQIFLQIGARLDLESLEALVENAFSE